MDLIYFFKQGGPIMWPLLLASIVALTVVIERVIFIIGEKRRRDEEVVGKIFSYVQNGDVVNAVQVGHGSKDCVAKVILYGLEHAEQSLPNALMRAANRELSYYDRGLHILDTIITLAPLLGLLGTVTGMIHAFGLLGHQELNAPTAITGGIAEALIATGFGLGIAITALIPFNYLNARLEQTRRDIEDAATHLELLMHKTKSYENLRTL